ncbi:hypothetical protein HUG20_04490 [Salicibibacter cibi]|uniref:Uncharacterized protein n=1 Tax=Salicibibacter cibi TaxID=2743001 RepID=A0A7T7CEM7_9BACI|nr:hypothetical protein [Salicibibacter cibi]QQK79218.1 hypothetical protein HUG20_04490 [Salicibibacter cibi]
MESINKKKATVISFPNEYGKDQFSPFLKKLRKESQFDKKADVRFGFLLKALDYMQYVNFNDLPTVADKPFFAQFEIKIGEEIYQQTFELIKPLNKRGIYELRINMKGFNWRFRGIFFPYSYDTRQFYCFIFPFEKTSNVTFNVTDHFRDRAYRILNDLEKNPEKYQEYF